MAKQKAFDGIHAQAKQIKGAKRPRHPCISTEIYDFIEAVETIFNPKSLSLLPNSTISDLIKVPGMFVRNKERGIQACICPT